MLNGFLVIDKPLGLTSRDALNRAWRWLPRGNRVGHAGTLDPLATGVLVVCAGAGTRLAEFVQRMEKVYRAGIKLGTRSTTDDGEGVLTEAVIDTPPTSQDVNDALHGFLGTIDQVPPGHSAAKVDGRRAYSLARKGKAVNLLARPVTIHAIAFIDYKYPLLDVEIRCGKGTYIRALARDLGERLGCGAYLESLRRTRIGHFRVEDALSLEADQETARRRLLPLAEAVRELPTVVLSDELLGQLRAGQSVQLLPKREEYEEIAVLDAKGELVAIGRVDDNGMLWPWKVFT